MNEDSVQGLTAFTCGVTVLYIQQTLPKKVLLQQSALCTYFKHGASNINC